MSGATGPTRAILLPSYRWNPYQRLLASALTEALRIGVSVADLLGVDGPFPDPVQIFALDRPRSRNRTLVRPRS